MGIDRYEAPRRHKVDAPKYSTKHPIAAIEKRVIDSPAFAALQGSAVHVLLVLARNLEKGKNGHIFLPLKFAESHGINKKTLYRALKTLTTHGFIFPTKRGGYGHCGTYALTWLPLSKDTKGLYVDDFRPCAWKNWRPAERKTPRAKMSPTVGQEYPFSAHTGDKNIPSLGDKSTHLEVNTNTHSVSSDSLAPSEPLRLESMGPGRQ